MKSLLHVREESDSLRGSDTFKSPEEKKSREGKSATVNP